jgi:PIN domain nuclease of toxin-antitoxin system
LLPRLLLDTHILLRWFFESRRLSRTQLRAIELAIGRGERLAFSAVSLLEIAVLTGGERLALKGSLGKFFGDLSADAAFCMLPVTYDVALEVPYLGSLRDPADRAIAATARVHRLKLVTSDQRIIESGLVPVLE